jgi:hypothetical protein
VTVDNFWSEVAFQETRILFELSTYNGSSYDANGSVRIYRDGTLIVDETGLQLNDNVGSGLATWDRVVIAPQGEVDDLRISD